MVNEFPKLLRAKGNLENKRGDYERVFLDKCNWLLTAIMRKNLAINKPFTTYTTIHSDTLRKYLGADYYKKVIKVMEDCEIIVTNNTYSVGRYTKAYRLTPSALSRGLQKVTVQTTRFENTLRRNMEENYTQTMAEPILAKVMENVIRLRIADDIFAILDDIVTGEYDYTADEPEYVDTTNEQRLKRYEQYYYAFKEINDSDSPKKLFESPICFTPVIGRLGRVYHIGASIPSSIRQIMRTKDNELLYEVDMASAQLSLLTLRWFKSLDTQKTTSAQLLQEARTCMTLLMTGGFYRYIIKKSKYCEGLDYPVLKEKILKTINAKFVPSELNKELTGIFPHFMGYINDIKKSAGHSKVSHLHQQAESEIFVHVYMELPKERFALLIHDCILVLNEDTYAVKEKLIARVKELYATVLPQNVSLDGLFKISRVSRKDNETYNYMVNQHKD